jgi:hypothetical protein
VDELVAALVEDGGDLCSTRVSVGATTSVARNDDDDDRGRGRAGPAQNSI